MTHRKSSKFNTKSKRMEKTISLEVIPKIKIMVTLHSLRWFFFLVFFSITVGITSLFLIGKMYTQMILTYSITGFFTFFAGYFGWIFARGVMDILSKNNILSKNADKMKNGISYHVSEVDD